MSFGIMLLVSMSQRFLHLPLILVALFCYVTSVFAQISKGNWILIDRGLGSVGRGNLYAVWQDARFSGFSHDEIAFSRSTDGGSSWSAPIKINKTPTNIPAGNRQAFTPTVRVAADGTIGVTYYDFRNNTDDAATLPTDYFIVHCHPSLTVTCTGSSS